MYNYLRRPVFVSAVVLLALTAVPVYAQETSILVNDGFLEDPAEPGQILTWRTFQHDGVYEIRVDASQDGTLDGSSVRISGVRNHGVGSRAGVGQISGVQDGTYSVYELQLRYKGNIAQADYLVWIRPPVGFDDLYRYSGILAVPQDDWVEVTVELVVPDHIRANDFRFEVLLYGRGDGTVWYDYARLVSKQ